MLGVIGTSRKRDERRVPIHPMQLETLSGDFRSELFFEEGYGLPFGVTDQRIKDLTGGVRSRAELMATSDIVLLFKPVVADIAEMSPGTTLWGCPHFVQDEQMTSACIERRLTVLTIEGMRQWTNSDAFSLFSFHRVSEMAGFCSVQHALQETGQTGIYGRPLRAVVVGFGSTGRGAVQALHSQGIFDVTLVTQRAPAAVAGPPKSVSLVQAIRGEDGSEFVRCGGAEQPIAVFLGQFDVIVNAVLQRPRQPRVFVTTQQLSGFNRGTLIVDVSCDTGMGFEWASPTSFEAPTTAIGDGGGITYYAVDHSPSLLWDAASWVISEALLPFVPIVLGDEASWLGNPTIARAVEMVEGVVKNPDVLAYQGRSQDYPHVKVPDSTPRGL